MHYFFAHIMHTWAPSYNQTLPSLYQIVNGLINFYVDNIYTHMLLICTHVCLSSAHSCLLLFCCCFFGGWGHQVIWLVQSSVQKVWVEHLPDEEKQHFSPVKQPNRSHLSIKLLVIVNFIKLWKHIFCLLWLIRLIYLNKFRYNSDQNNILQWWFNKLHTTTSSPHTFKHKFTV